jgi:hypothetical protein
VNVKRTPEEKAAKAAAARARFLARVADVLNPPKPPEPPRCLICHRLMPDGWVKPGPEHDAVCPSCAAAPLREPRGWGGYAGHCPDVSGGDSGWDYAVRLCEERGL